MRTLSIFVATACACLAANADVATSYKVSQPIPVMSPLLTDSTNAHGAAYERGALLDDHISIDRVMRNTSIAQTDTAGWIEISTPAGDNIVLLATSICPSRYAKGMLEVESQGMYEVIVDGASKAKKTTEDDSICDASKRNVPLEMLPTETHKVVLKLLSSDGKARLKASFTPDKDFEDVAVTFAAEGKQPFEYRYLSQGNRVTNVSISPDGKYMITNYRETFGYDNSRRYATLTDLKTGKVVNSNLDTRMQWLPRGSRLYMTEKVNKGFNVYAVDVPSMERTLLIEDLPESDITFSPNEDYILYYVVDEGEKMNGPLRHYRSPDDRLKDNRERSILKKYDLATGATTTLLFGNRQSYVGDISPDGKKLLVQVSSYDPTEWPFYFADLMEVDINTLACDTIVARDGHIQSATYSPDGKKLFVVGDPLAFDGIGKNCGEHPIPNISDCQGFLLDIATRHATALTRDFAPSIITNGLTWNAADGCIYFLAENGFNTTIYQLNPSTGAIAPIPQEIEKIRAFTIGKDEKQYIAYCGEGATTSGRSYLYDLKTRKLQLTADPWAEVADKIEWGKMEPWNFTSSDGTEIEGWITYPPDFDPSKKYPMIVYYYGGTSPSFHNTYSPYNPQILASRGYVVYALNPSGTTGYGQEFSARHVNAWGKYTANDIIEGTTKLLAEKDFINKDKIGCIGASYGGFMTQYLLTLTDIFAAAVSHAGISNVTSYWGEGDWGYSYNAIAAAKQYPWTNPELYSQGSLFNADKIHTPLLLLHGAADNNVPPGESIQIFNALRILGQEVELITVDNEDHFISDPSKRELWHHAIMAWFAKHLQDDPRWWKVQ